MCDYFLVEEKENHNSIIGKSKFVYLLVMICHSLLSHGLLEDKKLSETCSLPYHTSNFLLKQKQPQMCTYIEMQKDLTFT